MSLEFEQLEPMKVVREMAAELGKMLESKMEALNVSCLKLFDFLVQIGKYFEHAGIFLDLIWGQISASFQFKNEQNLSKMMYIIPNFFVLHFGEKFMKIQTKISEL